MTRDKSLLYWQAEQRASYYRWSAIRSIPLAGNDPITGEARNAKMYAPARRAAEHEGRVARIALAKHWIGVARKLR